MDTPPEAVAQDEDEGENAVTTVERLTAVSLQEAVAQEAEGENNSVHFKGA